MSEYIKVPMHVADHYVYLRRDAIITVEPARDDKPDMCIAHISWIPNSVVIHMSQAALMALLQEADTVMNEVAAEFDELRGLVEPYLRGSQGHATPADVLQKANELLRAAI